MSDLIRKPNYLFLYTDPERELYNRNLHRANVEYLLELQRADLGQIQSTLYEGFRYSLQNQLEVRRELQQTRAELTRTGDELRHTFQVGVSQINAALSDTNETIRDGFAQLARGVTRQIELHQQSYGVLQGILGTLQTPRATEAAECARLAGDNMRQALQMSNESRSKRLLDEAVQLQEQSLGIHDFDAKAHFDYAWLCRNYLNRPEDARKHFDTAALRAMGHEKPFAVFALRNAASVCHDLGDHAAACEATTEARGLVEEHPPELELEHARYLLACGRIDEALDVLRYVVARDPVQYHLVMAATDVSAQPPVAHLLEELFSTVYRSGSAGIQAAVNDFHTRCDFADDLTRSDYQRQASDSLQNATQQTFPELKPFFDDSVRRLRDRTTQVLAAKAERDRLAAEERERQRQEEQRRQEQERQRREREAEAERKRLEKERLELEQRARERRNSIFAGIAAFVTVAGLTLWAVHAEKEVAKRIVERAEAARQAELERAEAERQQIRKDLQSGRPIEFVRIPAGQFVMGSPPTEADRDGDEQSVEVVISNDFELSAHEVTVGQILEWLNAPDTLVDSDWIDFDSSSCPVKPVVDDILLKEGIRFTLKRGDCKFGQYSNQPIVEISWYGAVAFTKWLSEKDGREIRLPTEAEWEYAARAGTITAYSWGESADLNPDYGWYDWNSEHATHSVGQKLPNAWGLYDIAGNSWEWCLDGYSDKLPGGTDPRGGAMSNRVYRGGGWKSAPQYARSANRSSYAPGICLNDVGFRVFRSTVHAAMTREAEIEQPTLGTPTNDVAKEEENGKVDTAQAGHERVKAERLQIRGDVQSGRQMEFVRIPAGKFVMGSPQTEAERGDDEQPVEVIISNDFEMSAHEVTVGQILDWLNADDTNVHTDWIDFNSTSCPVKNVTDSALVDKGVRYTITGGQCKFGQNINQPMIEISWHGAVAYAEWRSLRDGKAYRLPTEAEWEYACRAGSSTAYICGDDPANLKDHAWYSGNSDGVTHPVDEKRPNPWGLYNMPGNVSEWTSSGYSKEMNGGVDSPGPPTALRRVIRGGSWNYSASDCRSASRDCGAPGYRDRYVGFRLVRTPGLN